MPAQARVETRPAAVRRREGATRDVGRRRCGRRRPGPGRRDPPAPVARARGCRSAPRDPEPGHHRGRQRSVPVLLARPRAHRGPVPLRGAGQRGQREDRPPRPHLLRPGRSLGRAGRRERLLRVQWREHQRRAGRRVGSGCAAQPDAGRYGHADPCRRAAGDERALPPDRAVLGDRRQHQHRSQLARRATGSRGSALARRQRDRRRAAPGSQRRRRQRVHDPGRREGTHRGDAPHHSRRSIRW